MTAIVNTEEALPYGYAKGMSKALDAALEKFDEKDVCIRRENSSHARHKRNVITEASTLVLLEELLNRAKAERRRAMSRERSAQFRERRRREDYLRTLDPAD